ncbi:MAG TPA: hypothetical protein VF755_04015 [Catenuloplanes sp.]|jgi:hypothetical protein
MAVGGWHRSDAWVFVSVVIADRTERDRASSAGLPLTGATLADVLSAAGFLHSSVPGRQELEAAIRRLIGAGLILVGDDSFEVATAGERLWRTRPFSGLSAAVDTVHTVLNRASAPGSSPWTLDEQSYTAAVREYSARVAESS